MTPPPEDEPSENLSHLRQKCQQIFLGREKGEKGGNDEILLTNRFFKNLSLTRM
jgi:hypothetical protein